MSSVQMIFLEKSPCLQHLLLQIESTKSKVRMAKEWYLQPVSLEWQSQGLSAYEIDGNSWFPTVDRGRCHTEWSPSPEWTLLSS